MFSPTNGRKKVVDSVGCQVIIGLEAPVTLTTIRNLFLIQPKVFAPV